MPPLLLQGLEAVGQHDLPQEHPVGVLLLRDVRIVRVGEQPEVVESAAHVHFFFRFHVKQRQVHGAAPAVAGVLGDVALGEQHILLQLRVEVFLHAHIVRIQGPVHEVGHGLLGAVGIVNLQAIALLHQVIAHRPQGSGGLLCQEGQGFLIAVNPVPHKVVGGVVADLQDGVGDRFTQQHEIRGVVRQADIVLLHQRRVPRQADDHQERHQQRQCLSHAGFFLSRYVCIRTAETAHLRGLRTPCRLLRLHYTSIGPVPQDAGQRLAAKTKVLPPARGSAAPGAVLSFPGLYGIVLPWKRRMPDGHRTGGSAG